LGGFFDAPKKCVELEKLETQIAAPDFWNDQQQAQKVVQQRSRLERAIQRQESFETGVSDAEVLFEFAETDESSARELQDLIAKLESEVGEAETEMLLAGETDANNAICSIQSGAGGTDAQDWAQMLLRMYLRWAEKKRFQSRNFRRTAGQRSRHQIGDVSRRRRIRLRLAFGRSGRASSRANLAVQRGRQPRNFVRVAVRFAGN
jgi:protein subunit release factor A